MTSPLGRSPLVRNGHPELHNVFFEGSIPSFDEETPRRKDLPGDPRVGCASEWTVSDGRGEREADGISGVGRRPFGEVDGVGGVDGTPGDVDDVSGGGGRFP